MDTVGPESSKKNAILKKNSSLSRMSRLGDSEIFKNYEDSSK